MGTTGLGEKLRSFLSDTLYLRCTSKARGCMSLEFREKNEARDRHWESSTYGYFRVYLIIFLFFDYN